MPDDVPADIDLAEGRLPEQGAAEIQPIDQSDKALDAVAKAFEEAETGRAAERTSDRPRDEAGRFAKAEADRKAAEARAPVDPNKPADTPMPPAPDGDTPGAWKGKADRAAIWATLTPEARKAISDREAEVNNGFKMYEGLGPYVRQAQEGGTTLANAVKDYWQVEQGLRTNFGEGIKALSQRFGIDPVRLGAWLQGQPDPSGGHAPSPQAAQQPASLTIADVERIVETKTTSAQRAEQVKAFFADATNNPHADDVASEMAVIIRAKVAANEPVDLKAVYQQALRLNPTHSERLLTEERAKWEKEHAEKQSAAAQKARRLGASVKPSAGPTQRPNGRMTPEQAAAAAFDEATG